MPSRPCLFLRMETPNIMPSDYTTLTAIKQTLNENGTTDDAFLTALIARASRAIDTHCQRFFVGETETRYFDAVRDIDGQTLLLDEDLLAVTELTNGDGDVIPSGDYVLLPPNFSPHYAIRLKASSSESWTYISDPENAIRVEGTWGYSNGTPDDIEQACIRLVVYMYKQRKNPFLEVGLPDGGQVNISPSMPNDIKDLLASYRKHRFA